MTSPPPTPPADAAAAFDRVHAILGHRYRLERNVAFSSERSLFQATDLILRRPVSLRVNFLHHPDVRGWFIREAEALGQLDHPAIRHLYDIGIIDDLAYRIGNWIEGEGLHQAVQRSVRPIPDVLSLTRDLLSALEHAHARDIIIRRLVPTALITNAAGRATLTDLRYSSYALPAIPPHDEPTGLEFMAPEIRGGEAGDPSADIYTAGAILYYALTGLSPALDASTVAPPSHIRDSSPEIFDRLLLRALSPNSEDRYPTASEMLDDLARDAGTFEGIVVSGQPVATASPEPAVWEKRLRRALGDDYELMGELGTGGFGRVYRVRDLHLERQVALKVLHPLLIQDPAVVERFRREAQLAARLHHPNIVNIFDIGGRAGLIWYTMEFIRGPNLAQLVERDGALTYASVMRLLREALSALTHSHAGGLVHRDIKPENILTAQVDGSVRITDFGLAIALRGHARYGGATSRSGTPQFASPEQLLGERVDTRTDLYSLAAVAYFALLGRPPFTGRTPEQILARQANDQIPRLDEERPDVPAGVVAALRRALCSAPEGRFASAAEFVHALTYAARESDSEVAASWSPREPRG